MLYQSRLQNWGKRCSRLGRRATATVEFAVIAPVLVTFVLGMIEVTRAVQVRNYLTDTARSGCRLGIRPGISTQNVKDNINTILTANGISTAKATITVQVNGANTDLNASKRTDQISVKIAVPISSVSWVPLFYFSSSSVESETMVMMHQ